MTIKVEPPRPTEFVMLYHGDITCLCGNEPGLAGFYPCNEWGVELEPTVELWPVPLYVCVDCNRIILYPIDEVAAASDGKYDHIPIPAGVVGVRTAKVAARCLADKEAETDRILAERLAAHEAYMVRLDFDI